MHGIVVKDNRSLNGETTAKSSDNEEDSPDVSNSASHMEILDGELTDNSKTKEASELGS